MAEITGWITIHGQHIPLMNGESKMAAVKRFVKGKKAENSSKRGKRILDEHNKEQSKIDKKYGYNEPTSRRAKSGDYEKESDELARRTVKKLNEDSVKHRRTIKGQNPYFKGAKVQKEDIYSGENYGDYRITGKMEKEKSKMLYGTAVKGYYTEAIGKHAENLRKAGLDTKSQASDYRLSLTGRYKLSGRNSFSPKVSHALTKLDTNKGVRIDGQAWKKVGKDSFMNENGFKINAYDMANRIAEAKDIIYYKKWLD